jgi:hypothetical protein
MRHRHCGFKKLKREKGSQWEPFSDFGSCIRHRRGTMVSYSAFSVPLSLSAKHSISPLE